MNQARHGFAQLAPLLLVIFIDSVGLGLIYPILSAVLLEPHGSFLPHMSMNSREFYYGLVTGVFMLAWFFGAAYVSELSDVIGRKKSLLTCLIGSFLGYLLTAYGIIEHSLWMMIAGRILDGFTAGSQSIAQASAVDIAPEGMKDRYLALVLVAITLGFVAGPIFGGILSDTHLVSWFSYDKPMFFAALLTLINIFALMLLYKESFVRHAVKRASIFRAFVLIRIAFKHPTVLKLNAIFFVFILGWACFFTFLSPFSLLEYHLSGTGVIYMMATMGLGFAIGNIWLVRLIPSHWRKPTVISVAWVIAAILIVAAALIHSLLVFVVLLVLIGALIASSYALIIGEVSNLVTGRHQGLIMGINGSVLALAFAIIQFAGGFMLHAGAAVPLIVCSIILLIASVWVFGYKQSEKVHFET